MVSILAYFFNKRLKREPVPVIGKNAAQEIRDQLEDISRQRNMKTIDTCSGLKLIRQNFDDWYNEINAALPLDRGDIDQNIRDFEIFINTKEREPSGVASINFLTELGERCKPTGKQSFNIEKKLSLDTIYTIQTHVNHFFKPTIDEKKVLYGKYREDPASISDEDIRKWKAELREQTNKIDESIRSALTALQCK